MEARITQMGQPKGGAEDGAFVAQDALLPSLAEVQLPQNDACAVAPVAGLRRDAAAPERRGAAVGAEGQHVPVIP